MEVLTVAEREAQGGAALEGGEMRGRGGRDSCLPSPCQVPRAAAWLAPARLFTSWE